MAGPQSLLQNFIQNTAGTQTTAQSATPSATNNGNPNTAYNWTTYLPTISSSASGRPSVNFDLLTAKAPASSSGYTPPFTADPYAAMVMQGMPQASSNENVNRILAGLFGGGGTSDGFSPNPGGSVTPPGTTTPPTTGTPTGGNGYGSMGTPIGPISGPIARDPLDWRNNYANAQSNTNLGEGGLGRDANMPWSDQYQGTTYGAGGADDPSNSAIMNTLSGLGRKLKGELQGSWQEFVGNITGENGIMGFVELLGPILGIPVGTIMDMFPSRNELIAADPAQLAITNEKLARQLEGLVDQVMQEGGADAQQRLEQLMQQTNNGSRLPEGWTNETWGADEWKDKKEFMNFANLFRQDMGSGKNPITGMPAMSLMEQMQNESLAKTMEFVKYMQDRRGNVYK